MVVLLAVSGFAFWVNYRAKMRTKRLIAFDIETWPSPKYTYEFVYYPEAKVASVPKPTTVVGKYKPLSPNARFAGERRTPSTETTAVVSDVVIAALVADAFSSPSPEPEPVTVPYSGGGGEFGGGGASSSWESSSSSDYSSSSSSYCDSSSYSSSDSGGSCGSSD